MVNAVESFKSAIQVHGLQPPDTIQPGKMHRFPGYDKKRGDDAGWCKLFDDLRGGVFGDFSTGLDEHWQAQNEQTYTAEERAAFKQRIEAERQQRQIEELRQHEAAAKLAAEILAEAGADPSQHPYAIKKAVDFGSRVKRGGWPQRAWTDALLIPIYGSDGKIWTLEAINADGEKDYLKGGRKRGGFHPLGKISGASRVLIGEGLATVAAVLVVDGSPAVAAMDSGNLSAVAMAVRKLAPDAEIILLADNDIRADGRNPGIEAATAAAQAVGGLVAVPELDGQKCDFWDLWQQRGAEAVKDTLAKLPAVATKIEPTQIMPPEPLRASLPPSSPYPVEQLGDVLGGAAQALHETIKAPLALCCQSVLAAAAFAAQSHFDVLLPWGVRKPLSLFLLTVADSGERKSAVDDLVLGAAKAQERLEMASYQIELEHYEAELMKWKATSEAATKKAPKVKKQAGSDYAQNDAHKAGPKPRAPIMPLQFVTDPTVEGLYKLLVTAQPSVALFSDEGGLLIGGNALNNENALKTMARWCKLWDGSPFDRVRAGDGSGCLYGRRMAMHQLAQPDVMQKLLGDRMANGQGLLARCLVAWPETTIGKRHIEAFENPKDRLEVRRLFAVLKTLVEATPRTCDGNPQELDPVELPLSAAAQQMAIHAVNQFEDLMKVGADLSELKDRTSKAPEIACRMAGVLSVIENGMAAREITDKHLERGLILMQWYLAEALRIQSAAIIPHSVLDAETLSRWLASRGIQQYATRTILNKGPNQLRNKTRLDAAIKELVNAGYHAPNEPGTLIDGKVARLSWRVLHVV